MSATLTILTALRDHLQAALPGYEVALFPDHPDSYRFIHPRGAVLIGYQGSKFTKLEALGMIAQQRDITLNLSCSSLSHFAVLQSWGASGRPKASCSSLSHFAVLQLRPSEASWHWLL